MALYALESIQNINDVEDEKIESFVIEAITMQFNSNGEVAKKTFESLPEIEGIVVLEGETPVGIIMRTTFYQKIGTLYGHSLFMNRGVSILMETSITIIDSKENISRVGFKSTNRDQSKLYDYLIVLKNNQYIGVVSIRLFLLELSKRNERQLKLLNEQHSKLLNVHQKETLLREDIEAKASSIKNLLNNAGQGFLSFSKDYIVKQEFSSECVTIFQKEIGNLNYIDLVSEFFEESKGTVFNTILESYFNNSYTFKDSAYLTLLPAECCINNKIIRFEYKHIDTKGIKSVMVILTDITEKKLMEKSIEEDRNNQRLLIKTLTYQSQIKQLIYEFIELFSDGNVSIISENIEIKMSLNKLFRTIHTYKGDFAQYGFVSTSTKLHELEEALSNMQNNFKEVTYSKLKIFVLNINPQNILIEDLKVIKDILGNDFLDKEEGISISKSDLDYVENEIFNSNVEVNKDYVLNLIKKIKSENIKHYLSQYEDYIDYLSVKVMKPMPCYTVIGDDIYINYESYKKVIKSLIHIFRNIMDHGIENEEERINNQKSIEGNIICKVTNNYDNSFSIKISDDGKGIDLEKIKNKAVSNNLYTASEMENMRDEEIINLIYLDSFSTKDSADNISGRGVGMSALKAEVENIGGTIDIKTNKNEGTQFTINVPYID